MGGGGEDEELPMPIAAQGAQAGTLVWLREGVEAFCALVWLGGEVARGQRGPSLGKDIEGYGGPEPGCHLPEEEPQVR